MPQKYHYKGEKDTENILVKTSNRAGEKIGSLEKQFLESHEGYNEVDGSAKNG